MSLQHVSLFSGVGGIDLGMGAAGIPTRAVCEIDTHARAVLARRFPNSHIYTDVREVTGDSLRRLGLQPRRAVLSAGFPCQDVSVAGSRRGMAHGTRTGLYWEVDRILGELRPAWVVLENVPGLLSACCACPGDSTCVERGLATRCAGDTHAVPGGACWGECIARHGGVMGAVLGSLAERGYGVAYRVLDSQFFGVPQRRRRVVIVGRLGDDGRSPAQVLLEPDGGPGNPAQGITPRPVAARPAACGVGVSSVLGSIAHTLTAEGHDASEDGTGRGTPIVTFAPRVAATLSAGTARPGVSAPGRRQEDDSNIVAFAGQAAGDTYMPVGPISPTLSSSQIHSVAYLADEANTLTAGGGERGYRLDSDSAAGGQLVAFQQQGSNVGPMGTLRAGNGSHTGGVPFTTDGTIVRRLTPVECERLQGFPDGWTTGQSDSQRYKQMGNAVTVPVFAWVARRIAALDAA